MEHRLSKRVKGKIGLLIYKRRIPVAIGQIKDASSHGLFIATDYTDVQLNQTVEMELHLPQSRKNPFRRIKAHVVRKSENGLGVDFDGIDNDGFTLESLIKWMERHHLQRQYFPVRRKLH